jgi:hypothetical protein
MIITSALILPLLHPMNYILDKYEGKDVNKYFVSDFR